MDRLRSSASPTCFALHHAGGRNRKRKILERLNSKSLDARLLHEIPYGANCSPFKAEAVLDVAKETCRPFLDEPSIKSPPGKVTLRAASADEPAVPCGEH